MRWICADEGGHLLACAASAPAGSYSEPEIDYEVHDPELLLFHSAEPGSAIRGDSLLVRMQPGRYVVATAYYKADARTEMVLHQFRPSAAGIRGGVVVLGTGVSLPDGTEVTVISDPASPPAETLGQRLMKYAGVFKGPTDLARNHDHYIHGTLRK